MEKNFSEKHIKYKKYYKSNSLYWGLGIENEFYLEFDKNIPFEREKFLKNHKKERYSLDYYLTYKENVIKDLFPLINYNEELPLLLNSHSFSKTDKNNNPKTLYTKNCEINPKFIGETLWESITKDNNILKNYYNNNLVFDGDSIEIITLNYYNTSLSSIIKELDISRNTFIENIKNSFQKNNIFNEFGNVRIMTKNHPYAVMLTNTENVCMFNNGTIHYNLTLPTELDENGKIKNWLKFELEHKNYIRLIQLFEPLFITVYGQPDPLSEYNKKLSSCSQRTAVSRYIGIGTFDTDLMKRGKLLVDNISNFKVATEDYGWYKKYYDYCDYNKLEQIGYDINFNKHFNHGVELRFFEHQTSIENLSEIGKMLIYLGDFSLDYYVKENIILNKEWNELVYDCMIMGKNTKIKTNLYNSIIGEIFTETNVVNLYYEIYRFLEKKYKNNGNFSRYTLSENQINKIEVKLNEIKLDFKNNLNDIKSEIKKELSNVSKQVNELNEQVIKVINDNKKVEEILINSTAQIIKKNLEEKHKLIDKNKLVVSDRKKCCCIS